MDNAVRYPSNDRLGRWPFAKSLAEQIDETRGLEEGYVIGLEGAWGTGKSSVVNMVSLCLVHMEMEAASDQIAFYGDAPDQMSIDQLNNLAIRHDKIVGYSIPAFDLNWVHPDHYNKSIAEQADGDERTKKELYRYFRLRDKIQAWPKNMLVHFRPWLIPDTAALSTVFIAELTKSIGSKLGTDVEKALKEYGDTLSKLAPLAGIAAQAVVPGSGSLIRDFLVSIGKVPDASLEERKVRLEKALRALGDRKLVVIIDDLDRLSPKEAVEMIGLVKSLGNLPNTLYLISYDPAVLAAHIFRRLKVPGEEYLEKIVQYRRRLPLVSSSQLTSLFYDLLSPVFKDQSREIQERFTEAWVLVGRHYVVTPRDVYRCADWYERAYRRLHRQTDPIDLLVLEILNAKDAELYEWIRAHIDVLCGVGGTSIDKPDISSIAKLDKQLAALSQLFPNVATALGRSEGRSQNSYREKRVQHREFAGTYFDLVEPVTTFNKEVLEALFSAKDADIAHELTHLVEIADASSAAPRLRANLFDTIWEHFTQNSISKAWLIALIEVSTRMIELRDKLSDDIFAADNLVRLSGAIVAGMERLTSDQRGQLLLDALEISADLSLIAYVIRRILPGGPASSRTEQDLGVWDTEVRQQAVDFISNAADERKIFKAAYPAHIVWLWRDLRGAEPVRDYYRQIVGERTDFIGVAKSLLTQGSDSAIGLFWVLSNEGFDMTPGEDLIQWAEDVSKAGERKEKIWADRLLNAHVRWSHDQDADNS